MSELHLVVNGARYHGWKNLRVIRSIESISGSFALEAADRWAGQDVPWPIYEEDACRVEIDGETVIDGFVDKRRIAVSANSRTLTYEGRDQTAALVDCSAQLGGGKKWSFQDADVGKVAKEMCAKYGIRLTIQAGLTLAPQGKCVLNPGDTAQHALHKLAAATGVLLVSDGRGGLLITRAGTTRIKTALVQGVNVLAGEVDYDATKRFATYVILTQIGAGRWHELDNGAMPTDPAKAKKAIEAVSAVTAEATDVDVRRRERVLVIRPETGMDAKIAKQRVDWEARVRAARSAVVTVTVRGWLMPGGDLWPLNQLVSTKIPWVGVDGDLLISQAEHTLDDRGGEVTQLHLVRPDAFLPEPHATVHGEGAWKELRTGAK